MDEVRVAPAVVPVVLVQAPSPYSKFLLRFNMVMLGALPAMEILVQFLPQLQPFLSSTSAKWVGATVVSINAVVQIYKKYNPPKETLL